MRRRILAIPLWFLIGAAISIAISWSIATKRPLLPTSTSLGVLWNDNQTSLLYFVNRGPGWTRRSWQFDHSGLDRFYYFAFCVADERLPYQHHDNRFAFHWGRLESLKQGDPAIPDEGCEHATGWPFPALWYDFRIEPSGLIAVHGGLSFLPPVIPGPSFSVMNWRALPYYPIWSGLAINSTIWGIVAFTTFAASKRLRTHLRTRRGHCPRCNYDLLHDLPSGCPECGWNRTPHTRGAHSSPSPQNLAPFPQPRSGDNP